MLAIIGKKLNWVSKRGKCVKAYVVAQTEVFDRDGYQPYADGFEEIFCRHGGKFVVSSQSDTVVAEGKWDPPNTVIMEFPDRSAAEAWLSDPEYVELAKVRHRTARTNMVVVDTAPDEYLAASKSGHTEGEESLNKPNGSRDPQLG